VHLVGYLKINISTGQIFEFMAGKCNIDKTSVEK